MSLSSTLIIYPCIENFVDVPVAFSAVFVENFEVSQHHSQRPRTAKVQIPEPNMCRCMRIHFPGKQKKLVVLNSIFEKS